MSVEGFEPYKAEDAEKYNRLRWWHGITWGDMFDKATDLYPGKVGLVDDTTRLTYKELREKTDKAAIGFMGLGIKSQDFVLLQLPNWHEFVISFFALQKIGAIPVLLISRHGLSEINYLSSLTNPTAWILPDRYKNIDYLPLIEGVTNATKSLRTIITARAADKSKFVTLENLIESSKLTPSNLEALADRRPDPMEVSIISPTGGTTGLPKAVPRTHNDFIAYIEYHSKAWEITSNDTLLTVAPVSHSQGMHVGLGGSFFNYGKYVLGDSTDPDDICKIIEREKVTAFPTVPALAQRIVNIENLKQYDLSSLKKIYCGGAPSTPDLVKAVYEKLNCKFVNAFGSSEGMSSMTRLDDDIETICTTVGRLDCPYNRVKTIDQYGNELPPNKEGEIAYKGPTIFTGYLKSHEENTKNFTADGFFKTGDLAKIDEKGVIRITGRIKDTILRGGETISAGGIERLVRSHPAVAEAAIIGMPDKALGERICAYIQLRPGATLSHEELIAHLKSAGASVMQLPERVEFIDSLPLTGVGKADKKALKEDIKKKLGVA
ncbi:MAG: AMP-binding protein [Syntrophorhabdales bacterium]|jgi:2,3-dihydroxybenzoate-AMP ligase/mycobactin salicyl-AMP ligase